MAGGRPRRFEAADGRTPATFLRSLYLAKAANEYVAIDAATLVDQTFGDGYTDLSIDATASGIVDRITWRYKMPIDAYFGGGVLTSIGSRVASGGGSQVDMRVDVALLVADEEVASASDVLTFGENDPPPDDSPARRHVVFVSFDPIAARAGDFLDVEHRLYVTSPAPSGTVDVRFFHDYNAATPDLRAIAEFYF